MVEMLQEQESTPAAYPGAPEGLSEAAQALDPAVIWGRIESYTAHRFSARDVVWTVEGPGEWVARLTPTTVNATHAWAGDAGFVAVTLASGPRGGLDLPARGPYRIAATVGSGPVPAAVSEAYRRLAEYLVSADGSLSEPGASSVSVSLAGSLEISATRNPAWAARAMQYSGAGDLLRPYRRA